MAMYSYDRSLAASAISAIVPDPSLQQVCICRSPRILLPPPRTCSEQAPCFSKGNEIPANGGNCFRRARRVVDPAPNLRFDKWADAAQLGQRAVLHDQV